MRQLIPAVVKYSDKYRNGGRVMLVTHDTENYYREAGNIFSWPLEALILYPSREQIEFEQARARLAAGFRKEVQWT